MHQVSLQVVNLKINMKIPNEVIKAVEMVRQIKSISNPHSYEYSSTQLDLPKGASRDVISFGLKIPDNLLKIDPEEDLKGREENPHITVLYGLDTKDCKEVKKAVGKMEPITVTLGDISFFSNKDKEYDVLKVDVKSNELKQLNDRLNNRLSSSGATFKDYKPHITIAYMEKGTGRFLDGNPYFNGKKITFTELTFSSSDGNCEYIPFE